jgi:alkylation response protein AidB-like acyl-CoA dehydrogenase
MAVPGAAAGLIIDSDEHRLIRDSVAKIAGKYGHSYYAQRSRSGENIGELWAELGQAGLLGVHLPEDYGGGGAGLSELVVVLEELAAHGLPLLIAVISPAICGSILAAHGSPELKRDWLPGIAAGTRKMAFALTEPDAGSNSHNVATTARPVSGDGEAGGDGWVISGGKYYISAADECEALLLVARHGDGPAGGRSPLSLFVVPAGAPGLTLQPIDTALVSPDKQFTVFLDNVRVGSQSLIGTAGQGLRQVFAGLNPERILAAALCNGVGRYAVSKASDYARQRQVWSVPIGAHQGIAHPLAQAHIGVELARLATARAAELFDAGLDAAQASNIAKFSAAEAALTALDQAIQTHGGNGLAREYGLADLWFVTRLMRTAPVSREMVLNYVAHRSLGLPQSY